MIYGAETWATTKAIEKNISRSDQRMLRHMAHVRWEDGVPYRRSEKKMRSEGYKLCAQKKQTETVWSCEKEGK